MTERELREQLAAMPPGALLPASWVLDALRTMPATSAGDPEVYTVVTLARRWHRSPSAVRALLESDAVPGAWKHGGRAWRIDREAVLAHERAQQGARGATCPSLRAIARGTARAPRPAAGEEGGA